MSEFLNLTTERQASYYLSAMKTFKYLNSAYEITDEGLKFKNDRKLLNEDMIKKLYNNSVTEYLIKNKITDINEITKQIQTIGRGKINEVTARRRASTIIAWINWALHEQNNSNN